MRCQICLFFWPHGFDGHVASGEYCSRWNRAGRDASCHRPTRHDRVIVGGQRDRELFGRYLCRPDQFCGSAKGADARENHRLGTHYIGPARIWRPGRRPRCCFHTTHCWCWRCTSSRGVINVRQIREKRVVESIGNVDARAALLLEQSSLCYTFCDDLASF